MSHKKITILLIVAALAVGAAGYLATPAWAQNKITEHFQAAAGAAQFTQAQDPKMAIVAWLRIAYGLIGTVLFLLVIYAGFLRFSAGGNEDALDKSNKYLVNSIIGLIIIFSSYLITIYAYRLSTGATRYACSSDAQCKSTEKCSIYGQCEDKRWCETSADCTGGQKCTQGMCEK
jgi:hypothetical protein